MTKLEKDYNKNVGLLITPRHDPFPSDKKKVFFISQIEKAGGWYFYHVEELGTDKRYVEPAKVVHATLHGLKINNIIGSHSGYTSWMFYKKS